VIVGAPAAAALTLIDSGGEEVTVGNAGSVGSRVPVRSTEVETASGVQVHVVVCEGSEPDVLTAVQPVITAPSALNTTEPALLVVAVMTTGVPKVAVTALEGSEIEIVADAIAVKKTTSP
jgi:hypothetical protein